MKNIWFDGGAWTCAWGGGVIQYLKKDYPELLSNYERIGGYSAGGFLALNVYLDFNEPEFWHCFEHETHGIGKYHLWSEETAKRCWELDKDSRLINDSKLHLVVFSFSKMKTVFKSQWDSYEDFVNFTQGTVRIPLLVSKGLHNVNGHGWSVDGGLTQRNPPDDWEKPLIISPWRNSDKTTIGPSKPIPKILMIKGDYDLCRDVFNQGVEDAALWAKKYL